MVTVCLHGKEVRYERARRACLGRLLTELEGRAVGEVMVESRTVEDPHDRGFLTGLRRSGQVSRELAVCWRSPETDPLLWAADIVVGATTSWLDGEAACFEMPADKIELID
ncbi:hypothetical protein Sru01_52010 [Sphaerisporangium rufum]|uniref:Uncharacterized protein n=1 Tax=Sphaerisporangium rufum TaxID=1381558 RepID=A0A919V1Y8_9ACTN|nr:hypothetical protein Sru01_52010 [Sphaerisporangium rufum]